MSLPRPILPIGNHYNEFGLYPVNILYFLSVYVFVQRLFPYIYISFYQEVSAASIWL